MIPIYKRNCFHREQVQLRSWLSAHCMCLGLCLAVRLLAIGPLGELWTRALWHGLLYRLEPVQSASHSTLLHSGTIHLLLHPPLLRYCGFLHGHSSHSVRIAQDYGAACIAADAHEQHPDNNCQGKREVMLTWITRVTSIMPDPIWLFCWLLSASFCVEFNICISLTLWSCPHLYTTAKQQMKKSIQILWLAESVYMGIILSFKLINNAEECREMAKICTNSKLIGLTKIPVKCWDCENWNTISRVYCINYVRSHSHI